jgi:outer membrane protein OmpA-like peptidoglycan-associated protein
LFELLLIAKSASIANSKAKPTENERRQPPGEDLYITIGARRPDLCPDTAADTRVDATGCELGDEIELPLVNFMFDSDQLLPDAFATLDEAVETLRMNPDLAIEVAGHTDSQGSEPYNLDLSQRRAETVRHYLIDNGVTNLLNVRGYGESEPVADNATDAGRAQNRRVVLRILSP